MKKMRLTYVLLGVLAYLAAGCASTGVTTSGQLTNVELSSPNFRVVATNVTGQASAEGVFGVSYGFGMAATQLAIIPLGDDRMIYRKAMEQLWANFESANGAVTNRRLALVNIRYDSESVNVFFYTKITTAIVADVVEFQ